MASLFALYRKRKEQGLARREARRLRSWIRRVQNFQRDILSGEDLRALTALADRLRDSARFPPKELCGEARQLLLRVGGRLFPSRSLAENAEAFLTAAILALTVRVFFFQIFSIPTNSMWPSYKGMTAEYPAVVGRTPIGHFLCGATSHDLISPESGPIRIPVNGSAQAQKQRSLLPYEEMRRWQWGLWPSPVRRYELFVGSRAIPIEVPREFDMEQLLMRRFFPDIGSGRIADAIALHRPEIQRGQLLLSTGQRAEKSEAFLFFEVIHGDVLLVDRFTPHFVRPRRGRPLVFATRSVPALRESDDRYYIKRLVALGGDEVAVREGKLLVNGAEANFSAAMEKNNSKRPPFNGYFPLGSLSSGAIPVPKGHGFVLGDNSAYSYDSRYFGAIPLKAVIGYPRLHLYPFLPAQNNDPKTQRSPDKIRRFLHFWERYAGGE